MAIYSRGTLIQTTSSGAACLEIAGYSRERSELIELRITLESAPGAVSVFGLGQAVNAGQGQTWLTSGGPEDAAALADNFPQLATAWSGTPPTSPTGFFRRGSIDNAVGGELIWTFPYGLVTAGNNSLVVWNITAVGSAEITTVWDD